jgi:formylglycine-generating enzyme required for sulfatase activity
VVALEPFLLDKYEFTVGRYRKALADGFQPVAGDQALLRNDDALFAPSDQTRGCTWNGDAKGPAAGIDRESWPLTCVGWYQARALCRFLGADLPSHAQWEYAAAAAGRAEKTRFPWGDEIPDCARAVFARGPTGDCAADGPGPGAVDAEPWASGDATPLGVSGMGGSAAEWTGDAFRPYRDPCWWQTPLHGVGCAETGAPLRSMRGGAWDAPGVGLRSADMVGQPPSYPVSAFGFRCARPGR